MRQVEPLLTPEEERSLLLRIRDGDREARDELITRNLRLVMNYTRMLKIPRGMQRQDLDHYGCLGLMEAAKRFDVEKFPDIKFSTYAMWWIRQKVRKSMQDDGLPIRVPAYLFEAARKMDRGDEVPERHREAVKRYRSLVVVNYGDGSRLADSVGGREAPPESTADVGDIAGAMKHLTPRERDVIKRRFYREPRETLDVVGTAMGISKERVRQIEAKALAKLRQQIGVEMAG